MGVALSIAKSGLRVGAAAFLLGLGLAGPQVLCVASADGGDTDGASVSTGPAKSKGGVAGHGPRTATAPRTAGVTSRKVSASPKAVAVPAPAVTAVVSRPVAEHVAVSGQAFQTPSK